MATGQGVGEDFFVGEFQDAAAGNAASKPGQLYRIGSELVGNKQSGAVPFHVRVRGHDNFFEVSGSDAIDEGFDGQLVWADSIEGGDSSEEDVVESVEDSGLFEGDKVSGLFDDSEHRGVALGILAHAAK